MRRLCRLLPFSLAALAVSCASTGGGGDAQRRVVNTTDRLGPYSEAVVTPGVVFLSGQIGLDREAQPAALQDGIGAQARQALRNLTAAARAAGVPLQRAVRVEVYLTDMGDYAAMNEVYREFFPEDPPARTCVEVAALPAGAMVEIAATILR